MVRIRQLTITILSAFLLGIGSVVLLYWISPVDSVPIDDVGGISIGLIQLVALFMPALALFIQALLRYGADRENRTGMTFSIGGLDPDEYRFFVIFAGFSSSLLLTVGLLALLVALDLPGTLDLAVTFIAVGMMMVPFTLGLILYQDFQDVVTETF